jgi:flagellar basal-body rod modification protein FlgD
MSVDNVQVNSKTGIDGNTYTASVSNDTLTNQDFLTLMLEELKMQDPTKPMDSQRMLDSQMQMSSIETNLQLVNSMEKLTTSYAQSALSNAANVIGKNVEDGNINEQGINKAYTVRSVVNQDGQVMVKAQEILFLEQQIKITDEEGESTLVNYNTAG